MNNHIKSLFASMETSGDTSGDWLQLEPTTFNDLQGRGKVDRKIKFKDIKSNPEVYSQVADGYIKDLQSTFGIPTTEEAALWSWRPGWYKKYKGKIENIPETVKGVAGKSARQVMTDRQTNLQNYLNTIKKHEDIGFRVE